MATASPERNGGLSDGFRMGYFLAIFMAKFMGFRISSEQAETLDWFYMGSKNAQGMGRV